MSICWNLPFDLLFKISCSIWIDFFFVVEFFALIKVELRSSVQARGPKKHLKRLNAPKHWMLDKLTGVFVSYYFLLLFK